MECPKCNHRSGTVDSRKVHGTVRRRRICKSRKCEHRFTTFEVYDEAENVDDEDTEKDLRQKMMERVRHMGIEKVKALLTITYYPGVTDHRE